MVLLHTERRNPCTNLENLQDAACGAHVRSVTERYAPVIQFRGISGERARLACWFRRPRRNNLPVIPSRTQVAKARAPSPAREARALPGFPAAFVFGLLQPRDEQLALEHQLFRQISV